MQSTVKLIASIIDLSRSPQAIDTRKSVNSVIKYLLGKFNNYEESSAKRLTAKEEKNKQNPFRQGLGRSRKRYRTDEVKIEGLSKYVMSADGSMIVVEKKKKNPKVKTYNQEENIEHKIHKPPPSLGASL